MRHAPPELDVLLDDGLYLVLRLADQARKRPKRHLDLALAAVGQRLFVEIAVDGNVRGKLEPVELDLDDIGDLVGRHEDTLNIECATAIRLRLSRGAQIADISLDSPPLG